MIPELPRWDEVDFVSKPYVGPSTRPPFKREWLHPTYALGPLIYGVDGQHLAQRWWAAYAEIYDACVYIYVVQAKADGSGWGKPRRILPFTWLRIVLGLDFGFNTKGEAIVAVHHNDQFGPPNATTVYYMVKDPNYAGAYMFKSEYLIESQGCVIACDTPKFTNGVDRVTYIFFINAAHQLCYVTDNGSGTIDFNVKTVSLQLGPTWEILHGGYRIDGKFQLAYRHDPDDPLPEQPIQRVEYDRMSLVSPPFKFTKNFSSTITHGTIGSGRIDTIDAVSLITL